VSSDAGSDEALYHELMYYTLAHPSPTFIHQHAVDAYAAQHATETSKPITDVFAVIGLYLYLEKDFTGKQVQKAHMQMAKHRKHWPKLALPSERGSVVIADVLAAPAGAERDRMIRQWCVAVWSAWSASRAQIAALARDELGVA